LHKPLETWGCHAAGSLGQNKATTIISNADHITTHAIVTNKINQK